MAERKNEKVALEALIKVGPKVGREHQQGPRFCSCGAALGDSVDWYWHLVNSTIRATVEHVIPPDLTSPEETRRG